MIVDRFFLIESLQPGLMSGRILFKRGFLQARLEMYN